MIKKGYFLSIILVLMLLSMVLLNPNPSTRIKDEDLLYLPNGFFLKGAALRYDGVLADLLWIKAIGYFSDQYVSKSEYTWLYHLLNVVTELDPYFQNPYEFGGIILANEVGDVAHSTNLLLKGLKNVPQDHPRYWYIPFFLAFNYWYYDFDFKEGAKYLEIASKLPGTPSYLTMLTARMYADTDSPELALPFLDEMIASAKTEKRKNQLIQRRKHVLVNFHLDILNRAVHEYYKKFAKYPNSTEDIVIYGIIKKIPVEPFGGDYYYDFITKEYYSTKTERLKVHERKPF